MNLLVCPLRKPNGSSSRRKTPRVGRLHPHTTACPPHQLWTLLRRVLATLISAKHPDSSDTHQWLLTVRSLLKPCRWRRDRLSSAGGANLNTLSTWPTSVNVTNSNVSEANRDVDCTSAAQKRPRGRRYASR